MPTRLTIDQLEKMKTHELADMLANVVLLLKRMPDVECKQLVQPIPPDQVVEQPTASKPKTRAGKASQQVPGNQGIEQPTFEPVVVTRSPFTREELAKKKLPELKVLAKELKVLVPASVKKKDDLIARILAKPLDGHSEQRAIQDI
jgi:hypothetical protein